MSVVLRTPNLARNPSIAKKVKEDWGPLVVHVREERSLLTAQWLRYENILKVRHDSDSYHGRHRAYLAIGRRVIENWVQKLKNDMFPDSGRWFQVKAETKDSEEGINVLEALFRRQLWDYMRVRRKSGPILRQLVTLGTSPIDIGWRYSAKEIPTLQRVYSESKGNLGKAEEVTKKIVDYIGPTCRPIDLFRWYAYPASVNDVGDLSLCFEDVVLEKEHIERLGRTPIDESDKSLGMQFENVEKALALIKAKDDNDGRGKFEAERIRLAQRGLHSPMDTRQDPNRSLVCTRGYKLASLQEDADGEMEMPRWYQFVTTGNEEVVLQVRPVIFWDDEPSYLVPKFVEVWEEFYGYGLPATFDSLAYMANDVLNQGADALTFSLNPIAAVDPGAVQDMTTVRMRPGAKWLIRNPRQNVQFMEPPKDSAIAAMQAVQQLIALVNDAANVAPFSAGGMTGPRARGRALNTATGMSIVSGEAQVQVHDVIQGIEDLWLHPMLRKMYSRNMQCLEVPVLLNVMGAAGAALIQRQVTREDLIGEYSFEWLASTSTYNQQVRGQQMIGFLQTVGNPDLMTALQQENKRVSIANLVTDIYSIGLQLPGVERIIQEIQPVRALDAKLENELYLVGRGDDVTVSPADDDMKHIMEHDALLKPGKLKRPEQFAEVMAHVKAHVEAMMAKQMMQQMQAMQQMGGMGGMPPMPPGMLPPPGGEGQPEGAMNPGRPPQTSSPEDLNRTMDRPPGMEGMGGSSGM